MVRTIDVAFSRRASGMFNVCDDEPSAAHHVVEFAAKLPGRERRPQIGFAAAQATMTPMMPSLYAENKRVRSLALRTELGVRLPFPTYRDGLRAEFGSTDAIRVKNSAFRTR